MKWHKYKAVRTNGFASKLECALHQYLSLLVSSGELKDLQCQDRVELSKASIACKIDFSAVKVSTGEKIYFESKGADTDRWLLIKKLWKHYGPAELQVFKGRYNDLKLVEVIKPVHGEDR